MLFSHAMVDSVVVTEEGDESLDRTVRMLVDLFDYRIVVGSCNPTPSECWKHVMVFRWLKIAELSGDKLLYGIQIGSGYC